jgi:diguanylate cyclase (GGDEF)-like protein
VLSSIIGLCGFFAVRMLPMRALEHAWTKATHDPLTGLPNRLLLADRIEQAAAHSARTNTTFAIHCLDLDHFKEVNDSRGHGAGDLLLAQAAERMRRCLRKGDTLARVGGDEFILLETDVNAPEDAAATAERLIEAVRRPFDLDGMPAMLTTSVGIALHEKGGQSTAELLQNADSALYRAKSLRRGTIHFFDKTLNERLDARKRLERELRAALAADQLELLYQPQISLPDGKITGVEALVRWHHPTRGILGADEFIPLAEETGLIVPVGEWVLRRACVEAIRWRDVTLAVNISPAQFRKGNIVATVRAALDETGFPGGRLELEITEGLLIADTDATLAIVNELRQLGVRFAMDDFGTGYSSLGYLHKFRFDKIKLDKSFVRDLGKNPDADAIAHTIIDLARTLKIRANAEGVETQFQLERLIAEGYGEAQGYLFTRPLNCDHIDQFIRAFTPGARASDLARLSTALAQI